MTTVEKETPRFEVNVSRKEAAFRSFAMWLILLVTVAVLASVFYAFVKFGHTGDLWIPIAKQHLAAVVGLPTAALACGAKAITRLCSAGARCTTGE